MDSYTNFAMVYDELMSDVDYGLWVEYIEELIKESGSKVENILELACGTGNITIPLAKKGYDIAGVDISWEMLEKAKEKAESEGMELVLLNQDMKELDFAVYNLDAVVCACDGFNYILEDEELEEIFKNIHSLLKEDGLFIFDISSYYKLSEILGQNTFAENREEMSYIWQNYFDEEEAMVEMDLAFFIKEGEMYKKSSESHYQRAYRRDEVEMMLESAGFREVKVYSDFTKAYSEEGERVFFSCKK